MSYKIERDGKIFVRRDLDTEALRPEELALQARVAEREARIDARTINIVEGTAPWALPKVMRGGEGITKVEQGIAREAMFAIAGSELDDSTRAAEQARRRVHALLSEGYELPESAITAEGELDYGRMPEWMVHGTLKDHMLTYKKLR